MFPVHTFLMTACLTSYRSLRVLEHRDRAPAHRVAGRNLSCARACPASFWRQCIFRLARSLARSSQRSRASCTQWGEENNWMNASEVQELCNGWGVSLCKQDQGTKSYSIAYWQDRGPRTDAHQGPRHRIKDVMSLCAGFVFLCSRSFSFCLQFLYASLCSCPLFVILSISFSVIFWRFYLSFWLSFGSLIGSYRFPYIHFMFQCDNFCICRVIFAFYILSLFVVQM